MLRSELARRAGCSGETLRYYEAQGLLRPKRRGAGEYRQYESIDVARVTLIRNARSLGLSLKAIRDLLRLADNRGMSCAEVDRIAGLHLTEIRGKIDQLQQLAEMLEQAIRSCSHDLVANCGILESLNRPVTTIAAGRRALRP